MRLIDGDYLYNKLVANKCPYDLVLQMVKDEPTVDVLDKIRAELEVLPKTYPFINHIDTYVKEDDVKRIIDKYKGARDETDN